MLTREVTKTTVKIGKMELVDGKINSVELPDEVMLGNKNMNQAQRHVDKKYAGDSVTVLAVLPETTVYEMEVAEFIKLAKVKETEVEEGNWTFIVGGRNQGKSQIVNKIRNGE